MSLKVTPITLGAFQLTRMGFVSCYLVREEDGFTLIDTGLGGTADDILRAAADAGGAIRRIALTHAHVDHVGSVDELAGKLRTTGGGSLELAASARSIPLLRQPPDKSTTPCEPTDEVRGGLPGIAAQVTHTLAGGELYGSLRVIETPGHIPGQLAFLDERDGTLYAGDALVAIGSLTVSGYSPWYFPLPNFATWNKAMALKSACKLLEFPIQRFACGHGAIRDGGIPALRQAIAKATA